MDSVLRSEIETRIAPADTHVLSNPFIQEEEIPFSNCMQQADGSVGKHNQCSRADKHAFRLLTSVLGAFLRLLASAVCYTLATQTDLTAHLIGPNTNIVS